jgi:hypothetical protein
VQTLSKVIFNQEKAWNKLSQKRLIRERGRGDLTKGAGEDDDFVDNVVKQMKKGICGLSGLQPQHARHLRLNSNQHIRGRFRSQAAASWISATNKAAASLRRGVGGCWMPRGESGSGSFSRLFFSSPRRGRIRREGRESEEREKTPEQSGGKGEKGTRGRP